MGTTYITVHGTGDQAVAAAEGEPKWWEPHSAFCRELLKAAPGGSAVEPFTWSGANDELDRRKAARALYKLLQERRGGGPIVLVGHSHGGSVITLTLKTAAARRDALDHVTRWVTVGAPFIQMRRRLLPWERYNVFGQAVLAFAVVAVFIFAFGTYHNVMGIVWMMGASAVLLICLGLLLMVELPKRSLYAKGMRRRFSALFASRWRGVTASHDEAANGLTRLPRIKLRLFDRTILSGFFRVAVSAVFIVVVYDFWVSGQGTGSPLLNDLGLGALGNVHENVFGYDGLMFVPMWAFMDSDANWIEQANETGGWLSYLVTALAFIMVLLSPVLAFFGYLALLSLLLKGTDLIVSSTLGRLTASLLNGLANAMVLKKAYGNTTVGELAYGVRKSPFDDTTDAAGSDLPAPINAALLAYARANAADTLAKLHEAMFRAEDPEEPQQLAAGVLVEQLSWRELIHTAYFKVPESRAYIVAATTRE